jgi:hypothetical protein
MRLQSTTALLAALQTLVAGGALAQPNLPPPPPPPLGQPTDLPPPLAPLPAPSPSPPPMPPPSHRTSPPPPTYHPPRAHHPDVVYVAEESHRPAFAVTLDPLPLIGARLSGNVEVLLAPHHSIIASPNVLFMQADRGGRFSFVSEGLGFAARTSGGFGIELGYHYYWRAYRLLHGPFFGPSLLLGSTTEASVGDPSHAQGYWGLAFDVGWQEVFAGGFTMGGGLGLGLVGMAGATAVFPRVLVQVGWSF